MRLAVLSLSILRTLDKQTRSNALYLFDLYLTKGSVQPGVSQPLTHAVMVDFSASESLTIERLNALRYLTSRFIVPSSISS